MIIDAAAASERQPGNVQYRYWLNAYRWRSISRASDPETGELLMTDGPYAEGKEHVGGFTIVDSPDLDAALAWAGKYSAAIGLPIEVRPFRY